MSTSSFSTSRRASAVALSGVASEHPNSICIGRPATFAPLTPFCGPVPCALPPALRTSAYLAPDSDCASNTAKGPPQVVSTPTLIGPLSSPPPPSLSSSAQPEPTPRTANVARIIAIARAHGRQARDLCPIAPPPTLVRPITINQESMIVASWYRAESCPARGEELVRGVRSPPDAWSSLAPG